ncbi:WD40 repeat domain-containing protein [Streptomyces sp. NPDC001833]|uniref:WD40 repeat domain-containing protein n=1 Tax=Streptomyces sp. NPDC001833 TaxID=3154658 RepID=UPI00332670D0
MAGRPESPLDPSAGPAQRLAAELRKLRAETGNPTYRVMAQRAGQGASTLSQAAAGERLPTLPVVLAYVRACDGDEAEWEARWREAAAEAAAEPRTEDEDAEPPYRGLARFEPGDANLFFGRDELTDRLFQLTSSRRFTSVFGPSGSGKSSLLRAGLIPRLRDPAAAGPRPAALRVLTPGEHPLRDHEQRLIPKDTDGDTWMIVDQFEELYTLCPDPAERDEFIDRLLVAIDPASRLRVVIVVRADFLSRCAEHLSLTAALQDGTLLTGPMSRDELREAIVKPAQASGMIVERSLTARILDEVEGEPGALPLMSHALLETWRLRKGRALTETAYDAAGGLHGAIARTSEHLYTRLAPSQADVARRLLLRLVVPGEGVPDTRRPVSRAELDQLVPGDRDEVLERMTRARLITLDGDTVDLAHEALLTAWPRLQGWIQEDRQRLLLHRKLTQDARAWGDLGRDPGALYRGVRLAAAQEEFLSRGRADELTPLEREFLVAGRAARDRERRRLRTFTASLSLLLVLALVAGVAAWQQSSESDRRRAEATARRIAFLGDSLRSTDPVLAMRLSVAAWRISATTETKGALFAADTQPERAVFRLPETRTSDDPFLSADGRTVVMADGNRVLRWNVATQRPSGEIRMSADDSLADVSSDGHRLLVYRGDGTLQVRDAYSGAAVGRPFQLGDDVSDVELGTGARTLIATDDKSVQVWDIQRHRLLLRAESSEVQQSLVGPDGQLMVLCTGLSGTLKVWDIADRRRLRAPWVRTAGRSACEGNHLAFGGGYLAATADNGVRLWDTASGRRHDLPKRSQDDPYELAFSADGRYLAVTGSRTVALWRVGGTPHLVLRYTLPNEQIQDVRIDPEAGVIRYLVRAGSQPSAIRTVAFDTVADTHWHQHATTYHARFSPDGRLIATARLVGNAAEFELRPTTGGRSTRLPPAHCESDDEGDECIVHMTFSTDGSAFAYGTETVDGPSSRRWPERIRVWDTRRTQESSSMDITPEDPDEPLGDDFVLGPDPHSLLVYRSDADVWERWDLRTGDRVAHHRIGLRRYLSHSYDASHSMALRPDGRLLATGYSALVALPSGRSAVRELGNGVSTLPQFSPSGDRLAVGDDMGWVSVWDKDGRRRTAELAGTLASDFTDEPEDVTALAFSPDGSLLAVGGAGGTISLWDVDSGQPMGSTLPTSGDRILALSFTHDGRTLQVAGEHVSLRTYPVDPQRIAVKVCEQAGGGLTREQWRTYLPELPYRDVC